MSFSVSYVYQIIDRYTSPLKRISQNTNNFEKVAARTSMAMQNMSNRLMTMQSGLGSLVGMIGGAALTNQFIGFEDAVNRVGAVTMSTETEFQSLRNRAKELGITTRYTATEAALGMDMLARNGLRVAQIMDGAIDATLALSAATGSDLANAANIATDVMLSFGKEAKELPPIMDKIAGVVLSSKFSIDDYRLSLAMGAGAVAKLGVSFTDFNTVIAGTAAAFSSGSDAGTSFKVFVSRLTGYTKEARREMARLGLYTRKTGSIFYDSAGQIKNMSEISEILKNTFGELSDAERTYAVKRIFGMDAMRTALSLAQLGAKGFDKYAAAIARVSAEEMAEKRMRGLVGATLLLKSALEGLNIAIFESGVAAWLKTIFDGITNFSRSLAKNYPWATKFIGVIGLIVIGLGALTMVLGTIVGSLAVLMTFGSSVVATFGPIVVALTTIVAGITYFVKEVRKIEKGWLEFLGIRGMRKRFRATAEIMKEYGMTWSAVTKEIDASTAALRAHEADWAGINRDIFFATMHERAPGTRPPAYERRIDGTITIKAPPGIVEKAKMETTFPGDLGFNLGFL